MGQYVLPLDFRAQMRIFANFFLKLVKDVKIRHQIKIARKLVRLFAEILN